MNTIGIIGFGITGRAIQHGFAQITKFRIYDKNKKISEDSLSKTVHDSDFIFLCLPTPMNEDTGKCDIGIIDDTFKKIKGILTKKEYEEKIFIIKSTVPPGTTTHLKDKYYQMRIIHNPEFLTERSYLLDFINSARIILGGDGDDCVKVADLYRQRFSHTPIVITTSETSELVKYAANAFFSTKLSFFNEIYDICEYMGINYNSVRDMILMDGRVGNSHTDIPGHDGDRGFGGKCFPKDINGLIYKAKDLGVEPIVLEAVWKKNIQIRKNKDWLEIDGAVNGKDN